MITNANLNDISAIAEIEQFTMPTPWSAESLVACLSDQHCFLVFKQADQICGYSLATQGQVESELLKIAVHPKHQAKGYGRQLLAATIEQLKAIKTQELWLEVRASNQAAIHLYQSLGFTQTGVRKDYYPTADAHEDAWLYTLILD